ncbi:HWE histidine kinase domain-containing protein [Benzoatithermus flavus]|uniref:histidine kinase n=1 Tax=Benzoatithermus flavus TaxID=3108223 RepID=A0ABU8XXU7_9PROT
MSAGMWVDGACAPGREPACAGPIRWWTRERRPTAVLLAGLVFFLLVVPLVQRDIGHLSAVVDGQRHTFELLRLVKSSLGNLDDAESARHEFLHTRMPSALERYRAAAARVEADLAYLDAAEASGLLQGRAVELRQLVRAGLAELEEPGASGREALSEQPRDIPPAKGGDPVARLRTLATIVETESWARIDELTARARAARYRLDLVLGAACLLGLVLFGLVGLGLDAVCAARRRVELHRAASEARRRGTVDTAVDGAPVIGRAGTVASAKPTVERGLGHAPHELATRDVPAPMPAYHRQEHGDDVASCATTGRWRADDRQALLVRELRHRVKNILAVVQNMALLTGRQAESYEAFREAFQHRLRALASANELLTGADWETASLEALVRRALLPHGLDGGQRFVLHVAPKVVVSARLAQDLALALHELATNAVKHGALAAPRGRVLIGAGIVGHDRSTLRLVWREEGGPSVEPPGRQGFGTRLLAELFGHRPGGEVRMEWRPEGLVCRIEAPLAAA